MKMLNWSYISTLLVFINGMWLLGFRIALNFGSISLLNTVPRFKIIFLEFFIRFRADVVKTTIQEILNEELSNKQYDGEETTKWSKQMSELIKEKLKSMLCKCFYLRWGVSVLQLASQLITNVFCILCMFNFEFSISSGV